MTNTYDKSGVLGGNYDSCALDFEAAHQALLKEVRNKAYAEGYEAGREHERNLPFANGQNPFKLGSRSEVEREAFDVAEGVAESFTVGDQQAKEYVESAIKETRAFNQQARRDEIVEDAKEIIATIKGDVDFVINKEKRTVVAFQRGTSTGKVISRGIAKCAPGDCFNNYIGMVIAWFRSLDVEVPEKYLNAPQPTEVRVGDVIGFPFDPLDDEFETVIKVEDGRAYVGDGEFYYLAELFTIVEHDPECDPYIIDDSRETEVGE
ncbi:hypothetical protein [Shouchella rhizosphaerae]|uniref:HNH endonuclease n=1 Tax=Shouchella rhizosphaerae TaxID=866786 RepID=A0ABZ2CV66_9BACI